MEKAFLHIDLDAFFASVEILDHPDWKNKPVIVGGKPEDRRSVVSTASYEARKYGVHSAMPIVNAVRLCPEGIYVHPRMERYHELSEKIMAIFSQYSPDVQQISVDEAFIDLTGTEKLFGSPQSVAAKIKEHVFKETGLTVSIGLASTKYLAKIASEINKPNGFYCVQRGQEKEFMLSLPLKKVWGIGEKTLASLNKNGIKTTRQIYEKPLNLLTAVFGNSMGNFLFNAVHGIEPVSFDLPSKSHSISSENTYAWDLTSQDAIDTALLELCYTVIWRMRKENLRSSTPSIKIRYEDFTTIQSQETSTHYVNSLDDLFERVKKIFQKKADTSKGIRLLGVGLLNTESNYEPKQGELFDFGEEKKQKVEEAIIKVEKKIPGVKITPARLLNSNGLKTLAVMLLTVFFTLSSKSFSQASSKTRESDGAGAIVFDTANLPPLINNESKSLFNYNLNDKNIEFVAEGFWKTMLSGGLDSSFGFGNSTSTAFLTPILSSEVDLSLWFLIDNHWYFQSSFAENFDKNTIAAGYYGEGFLREARIANRGISFPQYYSIDTINKGIGGGNNLSPGISAHFEKNLWTLDFALRYESLQSKSKYWYGKNSVSETNIELNQYLTGFQYILPSQEAVNSVDEIYVESSDGTYTDKKGRKYKKLTSGQYLLSSQNYSIFLTIDAKAYESNNVLPAVMVKFDSSYNLADELGTYGTALSPGTLFLGELQKQFSKYDLADYSLSTDFKGEISNSTAYYIQYPGRFSPFACLYRYDCGLITSGDASISSQTTGIRNTSYNISVNQNEYDLVSQNFFYSSHLYADVYTEETNNSLSPLFRFPFAQDYPEIYLGLYLQTDNKLKIRSYTPVSRLDIGIDAVPGTVRVYKNGIQDSQAKYDEQSGTVTLSSSVSSSDKISVYWYEDNSDSNTSSIAAAAGIKKEINNNLTADVSFSTRWTFLQDTDYSTIDSSTPGYLTAATLFQYSSQNFSFTNTIGASFETVNTQEKLSILNFDKSSNSTSYQTKTAAVNLSDNIIPQINLRDYSSSTQTLTKSLNGSQEKQNGIIDSQISGYAVPIEWDFTNITDSPSQQNPYWAAMSLDLADISSMINYSSSFSIYLRMNEEVLSDLQVYLQLGINADEDLLLEDSSFIPTWRIDLNDGLQQDVKNGLSTDTLGWQKITVKINDEDRQFLSANQDARIIITSTQKTKGMIFAGPYQSHELVFNISSQNNSSYYTYKSLTSSSDLNDNVNKKASSNSKKQTFSQVFELLNDSTDTFILTSYIEECDFSSYENLIFNIRFFSEGTVDSQDLVLIQLDTKNENNSLSTALEIELDSEELLQLSQEQSYKKINVNLLKKSVNFGKINKLNTATIPSRLKITITTSSPSKFALHSLYYKNAIPSLVLQDVTTLSYKKDGNILSIKDKAILGDFSLATKTSLSNEIKTSDSKGTNSFSGKAETGFSVTDFFISAYINKLQDTDTVFSQAGHSIKTKNHLLSLFSASDEFNLDNDEESLTKENYFKIDFTEFKIPVQISLNASSSSDYTIQNQNSNFNLKFDSKKILLQSDTKFLQKLNDSSSQTKFFNKDNYFDSWKKITVLAFDTGKEDSQIRKISHDFLIRYKFSFANLSPSYKFYTHINYKNTSEITYTNETSQTFYIPFSINNNSFSLSWKKTLGGIEKSSLTENYKDDAIALSNSWQNKDYYFKSLPIYDLFSNSIMSNITNDQANLNEKFNSLYYSTFYNVSWKRKFSGTSFDFFMPSNASLSIERDIKKATSLSDIYQIKTSLGFNALNIFGSKSSLHIFDFYEQDEYISSLTVTAKKTRETDSSFTLLFSYYNQNTFYIKDNETLKSGFEVTCEDENNYNSKITLIWKRSGRNSLLESPVKFFYSKYSHKSDNLTRTDSLNFFISKQISSSSTTTKYIKRQNAEYNHLLDIQINTFALLNTSLGLSYECTWDSIINLGANFGIGATIKF